MSKRAETMRRMQVGLMGIVLIVAVLAVSGAIMARINGDGSRPPTNQGQRVSDKPSEPANEPMERLGIAPADEAVNTQNATASNAATNAAR